MNELEIKRAIVSVYDKAHLNLLAEYFLKYNISILSTGGTSKFLKNFSSKLKVQDIADFTKFNEILEGRVKSLHPMIHAGILAKKSDKEHKKKLNELNIPLIDLVVVNLYPFEKIIQKTDNTEEECIENIDIGGPTLIRGAAKNFESITILSNPNQYKEFMEEIKNNNNHVSYKFRKECARVAFESTSYYESLISNWFNMEKDFFSTNSSSLPLKKIAKLRYGENPHQKASIYQFKKNNFLKISGKELSYNNICDAEIAVELSEQFSKPSCVILKHGNPCGVSLASDQETAYSKALKCDKVSAFGGIIAFNKPLSFKTALKINKIFTEVIVAPKFSIKAKKFLSLKTNLILIEYKPSNIKTRFHIKTTQNFLLIQEKDNKTITTRDLTFKTKKPSKKLIDDMIFAFIVCKYINSNAIVLAKNLSTIAIGGGQTSRLDSAKQAIKRMKENFKRISTVMASDGFFPFPDIIKLCSKNNIIAVIQPGGSKNDDDVINAASKSKIPLVFTGIRHFKH